MVSISHSKVIVENRKARHDYFIEETYEAGVILEGWEIKAIRAGRSNLNEAYVKLIHGELYLIGCHISPLLEASTHIRPDPVRTRKLLLHKREIRKLIGKIQQRGFTIVPLNLHFSRNRVKAEIGLAKGKKIYDKRATLRERDWERQKQRLLRQS